jgi:hypothetical protein
LIWRDLISKAEMKWKSKNSIRLKSQTGMQPWKTWMILMTSTGLEKVLEGIQKLQHNPWFYKECSKLLYIKKEEG